MFIEKYVDKKTDSLTVDGYEAIYEAVLTLANDADGFGLYQDITEEDIQKSKWIAAILEVMSDVPKRRMEHIFGYKKITFDYLEFTEEVPL